MIGWRRASAWMAIAVGAIMAAAESGAGQAPARDISVPAQTGTGAVSGVILHDDEARAPVRNAIVRLARSGIEDIRTTATDEAGRYTFSALPAGTYSLTASKGGYIAIEYGALRAGLPGYPVMVSEGERVTAREMALLRGGVIAGRVVDASGRPVGGVAVEAAQFFDWRGERRNRTGAGVSGAASTNMHGEYRIYGLLPGQYLVLVRAASPAPPEPTPEQLRWAEKPAAGVPAQSGAAAQAPTFHPGVATSAAAAPVTVGAGEERLGVDVAVLSRPVGRVTGTIVGVDGRPADGASIWWTERYGGVFGRSSRVFGVAGAGGRFMFLNMAPGDYTLIAQGASGGARGAAGAPAGPMGWGRVDVTVSGGDLEGLSIALQPGVTIAGRVVIRERGDLPRLPPAGLSIRLTPSSGAEAGMLIAPSATSGDDGTFAIGGVPTGRYRATVVVPAAVADRWQVVSAVLGDVDLLDVDADLDAQSAGMGLVVTLSDRITSLGGTLTDASGRAMTGLRVLVFSADSQHWLPTSRRVHNAPVDDRGVYVVDGLPPGEYHLVALTEVDRQLLYEPSYLEQFVPFALKVSLADGERKRQDLRVGGARLHLAARLNVAARAIGPLTAAPGLDTTSPMSAAGRCRPAAPRRSA